MLHKNCYCFHDLSVILNGVKDLKTLRKALKVTFSMTI